MKRGWENPYAFVCDNVEMAEFFIKKAREDDQELRARWCLNIAAGALYSAIHAYNDDVAEDQTEKLPASRKSGTGSPAKLANLIRHGAVHFEQDQGIGEAGGAGDGGKVRFFWAANGEGIEAQIPIGDILDAMSELATTVREHCLATTKTWYMQFG